MGELSRKQLQAYNNAMTVLRHYGLQVVITGVKEVPVAGDRVFFWCTGSAVFRIGESKAFKQRTLVGHGGSALKCWREERGECSMQLVLHYGGAGGRFFLEADFDEANPHWDLVRAVKHGVEVFWHWLRGRYTNPFVIRAMLSERGIEVPETA